VGPQRRPFLTSVLTPKQTDEGSNWYLGTADAIYQNIDWLDRVEPEYVLILSGDHVYSCTYDAMLKQTIDADADCTIAVYPVAWEEAPRFGILVTDKDDNITDFQEKPKKPISNLASMGIYIFPYKVCGPNSSPMRRIRQRARFRQEHHPEDDGRKEEDGGLYLPWLLEGRRHDCSLHQANMDLLLTGDSTTNLYLYKARTASIPKIRIARRNTSARKPSFTDSLINQGAVGLGAVDHCVVSGETLIEEGASCKNAVIMNGAVIKKGAVVEDCHHRSRIP
jgi:glucose-1-phosphate adenylyltransferase